MRCVCCRDGQRIIYSTVLSGCMCACEDVCVSYAGRMVLMHINVMILSAVRSRPLVHVSFHVHYFASYFDITKFEIHHKA